MKHIQMMAFISVNYLNLFKRDVAKSGWPVKVFMVFDLRLDICLHISWAGSNFL